jgi:hypothetical protein
VFGLRKVEIFRGETGINCCGTKACIMIISVCEGSLRIKFKLLFVQYENCMKIKKSDLVKVSVFSIYLK